MTERRESGPASTPTGKRMSDLAGASANAIRHEAVGEHETQSGARQRTSQSEVERIIEDWPEAPKTAAETTIERYGPPNEATPTKLFWYQNGPWKRTVVTRDVVTHHFPMPHSDYVKNIIDYQVPPEKFDDLASFDGSCLPDRTAGEVGARCDSEWANIITLNLMHDIVTGAKSVEEARKEFADVASAYALGRPAPYAERLQFEVPHGGTEYVDESMVAGAMVKQGAQKMIDVLTGQSDRT